MRRKECLYAVIGGVVGAVLTMAAGHVMPIGAQNGDATFGEMTCTALLVMDTERKVKLALTASPRSGLVYIKGKPNRNRMLLSKDGMSVLDGEHQVASISANDYGGYVSVRGKDEGR